MDLKHLELILGIAFLILSLGVHEAAHALVAYRCGDDTAREQGRLTLNPLAHLDPVMSVLVPAVLFLSGSPFLFGGAKPVPVNYYRLRRPLRDMMLVALAGPISNVLLALLFSLAWKVLVFEFGMSSAALAPKVMQMAVYFNLVLALFNMIPIPPLDGSRVMAFLLPSGLRDSFVALERYGMLLVIILLFSGALHTILAGTLGPLFEFVDFSTGGQW